jgi:hypothetical protein
MNNPCKSIIEKKPNIKIIAKSSNRHDSITRTLDRLLENHGIDYSYCYGAGLWYISIYADELSGSILNVLENTFKHGPTDSCMIFVDRELYDPLPFKYYSSFGERLIGVQKMESNVGQTFKFKDDDNG